MKKKLKGAYSRISKSKESRILIANFGYLSLLQIAGYVFPLLTMPYLARVIGVDSFGNIALAAAIIGWFTTIADWGFNFTATRDVAKNRHDKEKVSEIFSNALWARIFLMILSFILLLVCIYFIPLFQENKTIILATFLLIPGYILFPDWFFQAMEKMKYITLLNVISKLLFTILVFVFIKQKADYILQPLFIALGYFVSGVITMYIVIYKWEVNIKPPVFKAVLNSIRESTDVFINNLMPNLYNSFSIVLLGYWGGPVENGILNASRKFTSIAHQFVNVISRTFFPFLSRKIDKHTLFAYAYIMAASILSLLLFIFAPLLIKTFFTPEFYDAILALRIASISTLLVALSKIYGTNYMIIEGYERELRNITIIASIIGLCISIPLIYYYGYIGAALTLTITQGILGVSITYKALKLKKNKKPKVI